MIPIPFCPKASQGNNSGQSFNKGMAGFNVLAVDNWQGWGKFWQPKAQNGLCKSNEELSFHNNGDYFERPLSKGPTWEAGRVCEHCKTNVSRWRDIPLISLDLKPFDLCMLTNKISNLERQEQQLRLKLEELVLLVADTEDMVVVK